MSFRSRTRSNPDPRWLDARYAGACAACSAPVKRGDPALYFPTTRSIHCKPCGEQHDRNVAADDFDQAQLNGGW